jgi:hypothetical protein
VTLRFRHDIESNRTTITLVYPLTNEGSQLARGDAELEDYDSDPRNQNSVIEGLDDLVYSVMYPEQAWPLDPRYVLIQEWGQYDIWPGANDTSQFVQNPAAWEVMLLVGGSYSIEELPIQLVYSDTNPDVKAGDFSGNGEVDEQDLIGLFGHLQSRDGDTELDADGEADGKITIPSFGPNFSVYDMNYDGVVDLQDYPRLPVLGANPADFDRDGDVDEQDIQHWQSCHTGSGLAPPAAGCYDADLDRDFDVDQSDFGILQVCLSGSNIAASPSCAD